MGDAILKPAILLLGWLDLLINILKGSTQKTQSNQNENKGVLETYKQIPFKIIELIIEAIKFIQRKVGLLPPAKDFSGKTLSDFRVRDAQGHLVNLSEYKGKIVLIVNVASKCGFTPQYKELQALYQDFKDSGLVILGFPCNQFGKQEPGNNEEIASFCSLNYSVTFPVLDKVEVNGKNAEEFFEWLKEQQKGVFGTTSIKWNFTKFLIDRNGKPIQRFGSNETPQQIRVQIEKLLKAQ